MPSKHTDFVGRALGWVLALVCIAGQAAPSWSQEELDLTTLSLEDLVTTRVSIASRSDEALFGVAAAVTVISNEDIRRSGVTSIAEALRLVPGMQVARLDGSKWAISARGSNSRFANNLLVLIDGRSIYTPVFSGVYWEIQDLMLDDVAQIEVIRGPGATLWGANAFSGVINIVTKTAAKTRGTLVKAGAGSEERAFGAVRYGARLGQHSDIRIFARSFDRDEQVDLQGRSNGDSWRGGRIGFRADWTLASEDRLMLQGTVYDAQVNNGLFFFQAEPPFSIQAQDEVDLDGGHLLARWERRFSATADMALQVYFDRTHHEELYLGQRHHTVDVDFQHRFSPDPRHEVVWGAGVRMVDDDLRESFMLSLDPDARRVTHYSTFIQDDIAFQDERLHLILGSKLEHNAFTGLEIQPNVRALWAPRGQHALWAAVSRAVRTPSRVETEGQLVLSSVVQEQDTAPDVPIFTVGSGSADLRSQKILALEMGYRLRPTSHLFLDLAAYYHFVDDLVATSNGPFEYRTDPDQVILPALINNAGEGRSYGVEVLADWEPSSAWRLHTSYSYLKMRRIDQESGLVDRSPHVLQLRSHSMLSARWSLDGALRSVSERPIQDIDGYVELDVRLAWDAGRGLELSLIGQNLLHAEHQEGITRIVRHPAAQMQRGVYGQVRWER